MANITNLPNTSIHERIKKLEKNGYITKHFAILTC
ncbi:winged helix-turn-helix transcriptional regulator [Wenyingzhuangia marina]